MDSAGKPADWHTCNAIETPPVVHAGRLAAEVLDDLRRERGAIEALQAAKAVEAARDTLAVGEAAHRTAEGRLADLGRGLPDPGRRGRR